VALEVDVLGAERLGGGTGRGAAADGDTGPGSGAAADAGAGAAACGGAGAGGGTGAGAGTPCVPGPAQIRRLCAIAAASAGVADGHVAVEFVDEHRIAALNAVHRGRATPTDVLSFPIDGAAPLAGGAPRELGDVVICPTHTADLCEAVVHGVLHLVGLDHETDSGQMLALQAEILRWEGLSACIDTAGAAAGASGSAGAGAGAAGAGGEGAADAAVRAAGGEAAAGR
jgi:probable rRNA maturation factor